jgi:hypothetical protein
MREWLHAITFPGLARGRKASSVPKFNMSPGEAIGTGVGPIRWHGPCRLLCIP